MARRSVCGRASTDPGTAEKCRDPSPLYALFKLKNDALDQRRQNQDGEDLANLEKDVARAHRERPGGGVLIDTEATTGDVSLGPGYRGVPVMHTPPVVRGRSGGVISPEGGYKVNSITCMRLEYCVAGVSCQ